MEENEGGGAGVRTSGGEFANGKGGKWQGGELEGGEGKVEGRREQEGMKGKEGEWDGKVGVVVLWRDLMPLFGRQMKTSLCRLSFDLSLLNSLYNHDIIPEAL